MCTVWFYHRIMQPKGAGGMADSVESDQTAVCPDLSVQKQRIIMPTSIIATFNTDQLQPVSQYMH